MDQTTYFLPGGYPDEDNLLHREVVLAPLSGREEEFLAGNSVRESASLVTTILSRCIQRIGAVSPVSEELTRNLLIADRQFLLLKLRAITFGDQVQATLFCPWANCGKKVDIDFSIQDIPVRESEEKGPIYGMKLSIEAALMDKGESLKEITFRLPNGADQEIISPLLAENDARALRLLLGRCIESVGGLKNPGEDLINRLSPRARMEIEQQIESVAPKVDLTMGAICPECGREFDVPFDLQEFFFGEMKTSQDLLYREVHYLAYHYHWSEQEIMEMPREKRRNYIEVLADEIERINSAV